MEGSRRNWLMIIIIMLCGMLLYPKFVQATDQDSLNSVIYDYASKNIPKPRTGKMYEVSDLPSNLSGIEASIIRLRTSRLWKNGINFTSFEIPPKILPQPFTRRVDIVYRNLGNRSRNYYGVPNHTLVAPVIGFLAYDSDAGPTNHGRLVQLSVRGDHVDDHIIVRFRNIISVVGMKCVRFDSNGTFGLSELTVESSCLASGEGHFSVVVPNYDRLDKNEEKRVTISRWIIGLILSGVMGLVFIIGVMVYRLVKWKKVKEMEKMSERSEALDTIWIGNSKMFSASGIRTPPVIENTYVP
ncbi:hypothetical protein ABFS82_02G170600 [Erythranthe guttata]|nr:PREDICTED: uncharacterized protein LOC105964004 [Erythranthe guttata]|eukprot:XP_012843956.1 PREDICTED: uncharacterized protein LOC105964004 [Erythranthe guttata]